MERGAFLCANEKFSVQRVENFIINLRLIKFDFVLFMKATMATAIKFFKIHYLYNWGCVPVNIC